MIKRYIDRIVKLLSHCLIGGLLIIPLSPALAQEAGNGHAVDEGRIFSGEDLASLQSSLAEMKEMAPKLRIMLRSLRTQVGIDTREVFTIERGISQSQQDIERLIAMHQRGAVNQMRAHFLADDMRRKADGLRESLAYVVRRSRDIEAAARRNQGDEAVRENDDALVEMLGNYSALVDKNLALLQAKLP